MPMGSASTPGPEPESRGKRRPGRAPVSCLECRRLKLRCDRQVPCGTCRRRGCAALCPNGTMQTGRNNRTMALLNANEMQEKVDSLTTRVLELEEALRLSSQGTTSDNNSLLSNASSPAPSSLARSKDEGDILDAFGTLSLGSLGDARYFGNTARSEYLVHAPGKFKVPGQRVFPRLNKEILDAARNLDADAPELERSILLNLVELLPPLPEATRLCEIYLEHGWYLWDGIPREEFIGEVMLPAYDDQRGSDLIKYSHGLSLLFTAFALATLFDTNSPPCSVEAEEYYLLSRVALRLAPPLYHTTLWSIHSLLQLSCYLQLSDCEYSHHRSTQAWMLVGLAVRLGYSIGLHTSNDHWKLDQQASLRRGRLFWQIFVRDTWMSFDFGRPPSTYPAFIDCELPDEPVDQYQPWMTRYTRLVYNVIATAFGATRPTYQVILDLDRKVRDFPITKMMECRFGGVQGPQTRETHLNRWFGISAKEAVLVHLHRSYFARALTDQPADLLKHKFAPSVVSIFRSAWRLIEGVLVTFRHVPHIMARVRLCWSHAMAAAIVMCLVVTRAPSSRLAIFAFAELDRLCVGLQDASATHLKIHENNLDVVKKLRNQAHEAINQLNPRASTLRELDRLGGKSQVVIAESLSEFAPSSKPLSPLPARSPVDSRPSPSSPDTPTEIWSFDHLHPSIIDDWRMLEAFSTSSTTPPDNFFGDPSSFGTSITCAPATPIPTFDSFSQCQFADIGTQRHRGRDQLVDAVVGNVAAAVASAGPLTLDPCWQSFVEQLGF